MSAQVLRDALHSVDHGLEAEKEELCWGLIREKRSGYARSIICLRWANGVSLGTA